MAERLGPTARPGCTHSLARASALSSTPPARTQVQADKVVDQLRGSGIVGSRCRLLLRRKGKREDFAVTVRRCSTADVAQAKEIKTQVREMSAQCDLDIAARWR